MSLSASSLEASSEYNAIICKSWGITDHCSQFVLSLFTTCMSGVWVVKSGSGKVRRSQHLLE